MSYYINSIKRFNRLERDIKELIPDMNLRRRMSRVVKMGVTTAVESLEAFEEHGYRVDAVITATGLGCIANSEKFLANLLQAEEQMLNPTPFIQSTFNTVGAQVALIKKIHGYNNTFSHRYLSFESALVDAMSCLDDGRAKAVLVEVFDEATPAVEVIMRRMGLLKNKKLGEGAIAFVLTANRLPCSVAELEEVSFDPVTRTPAAEGSGLGVPAESVSKTERASAARWVSAANETLWSGAVAQTMADFVTEGGSGWICNDLGGVFHSRIKVKFLCGS